VDAVRFTLADTAARRDWTLNIAQPFMRLAFDLATETGNSELLADLITAARTTGIFTHTTTGEPARRVDPAYYGPVPLVNPFGTQIVGLRSSGRPEASGGTPHAEEPPGPATSLAGEPARLLGAEGFRLSPSPFTRTTKGTLPLARYIEAACARYTIPLALLRTSKIVTIS